MQARHIPSRNFESRAPSPGLFLAVILGSLVVTSVAFAGNLVTRVSGDVEIGHGDPVRWTPARKGDEIVASGRIRTGSDGRVEIMMESGTIRVHENSMLKLPPARDEADRVDLEKGHSLFDVLRRAGRRFEVHTPTVVVSVKGTRFGVDASDEVGEVAVYRGVVGVRTADAADAIETLVREGFLASGGGGIPIELDVAPSGDPWANWADLRRELQERPAAPDRMSDVDRAKQTLHRATSVDVLKNAAERKPEIAERLRRRAAERAERGESDGDASKDSKRFDRDPAPMPAAPAMDADDLPQSMELDALERRRDDQSRLEKARDRRLAEKSLRYEDLGSTRLSYENIEGLGTKDLMMVIESVEQVETTYESSGSTMTSTEIAVQLEAELVASGMDPLSATAVVNKLIGN